MGSHPCVFTETGIPYDLEDKKAYQTGDFSSQISALDAVHFALEGSMSGFTLWTYTASVRPSSRRLRQLTDAEFKQRTITSGEINGMAKTCQYSLRTMKFSLDRLSRGLHQVSLMLNPRSPLHHYCARKATCR